MVPLEKDDEGLLHFVAVSLPMPPWKDAQNEAVPPSSPLEPPGVHASSKAEPIRLALAARTRLASRSTSRRRTMRPSRVME